MKDQSIIGFESFVRWQHPTRGIIVPDEFIPIAEEIGWIVPLSWQIAEKACRQSAIWNRKFPGKKPLISINLSALQFAQTDFVERFAELIQSHGAVAESLCIEVTEGILMGNPESIRPILVALRELGIQIAIDDFGTGYSSLAYLHSFSIDTIKIDRSFINSLSQNQENQQIVQTIIDLGKSLRMRVVAEGVETARQLELLMQMGCEFAQGFYWSRPVKDSVAESMLVSKINPTLEYPSPLGMPIAMS